MSNASLKDQLQAVASQLSDTLIKTHQPKRAHQPSQTTKRTSSKGKLTPAKVKQEKPKPKWLMYVQYGVELLCAYFPQTFKKGGDVKPLKKGIKQDLIKALSTLNNIATEDKACMVKSLSYYVNMRSYLKNVVEGAIRVDLEGNQAGVVSAEEASYSNERYQAKLQAKQTPTKAAEVKPVDQDKGKVV